MESCCWVFKQPFHQSQVYRTYQIMPHSTALCTPISQMEAKQNEKGNQDSAVLVVYPIVGSSDFDGTSGQLHDHSVDTPT